VGRKTELQTEDVFAAISAVLAGGKAPTTVRVRAQLGDRGSPIVLQRFIDDWYDKVGRNLQVEGARGTPTPAPQPPPMAGLQDELRRLTEATMRDLDRAQAERVAALDTRAAGLDARETDLLAREQRQDERELQHQAWIEQLQADRDQARADQRIAEQVRDAHAAAAAAAELTVAEVQTTLAARDAQLAVVVERDRAQAAELRRLAGLEAEVRHSRGEVEHARKQSADLQAQLKEANSRLAAARSDRDDAEVRVAEVRASLADTRSRLVELQASSKATESQATQLAERLTTADANLLHTRMALANAEAALQLANDRLAGQEAANQRLSVRTQKLEADLDEERGRHASRLSEIEREIRKLTRKS